MLEYKYAFLSKAVIFRHIVFKHFYINRKVNKTPKKDINIEIGGTGESVR